MAAEVVHSTVARFDLTSRAQNQVITDPPSTWDLHNIRLAATPEEHGGASQGALRERR
jgi:hypothetical protein